MLFLSEMSMHSSFYIKDYCCGDTQNPFIMLSHVIIPIHAAAISVKEISCL